MWHGVAARSIEVIGCKLVKLLGEHDCLCDPKSRLSSCGLRLQRLCVRLRNAISPPTFELRHAKISGALVCQLIRKVTQAPID